MTTDNNSKDDDDENNDLSIGTQSSNQSDFCSSSSSSISTGQHATNNDNYNYHLDLTFEGLSEQEALQDLLSIVPALSIHSLQILEVRVDGALVTESLVNVFRIQVQSLPISC